MAIVVGNRIGRKLADAFGIPSERLLGFEVHVKPNELVTAKAEYAIDIDAERMVKLIKQFELEAREVGEPSASVVPKEDPL